MSSLELEQNATSYGGYNQSRIPQPFRQSNQYTCANQSGQNINQFGFNTNQSGRNTNQFGFNTNQNSRNTNQFGYNTNQSSRDTNQFGFNTNQSSRNTNQFGYNTNQFGYNPNQSGINSNHVEYNKTPAGRNADQFGYDINQFGFKKHHNPRAMQNDPNKPQKPSRLVQMQADYQRNITKKKEEKLIQMYEENQQRALQRVNQKKGMVREFFNERRTNGSSPGNRNAPTMEQMFKQKKQEHEQTKPSFGYKGHHYTSQNIANSASQQNQSPPQPASKQSAGRDRSNLLAPIQKPAADPNNPFPKKAQIVRPRTYKGQAQDKENMANDVVPRSAPTGNTLLDFNDSMSDDSPPPNAKQLAALQQRRKLLQSQRSNKSVSSVTSTASKPTDFQKWQMEQDRGREVRLQKQREKMRQHVDDEGYEEEEDEVDQLRFQEDMKKKQQELLKQIEDQQRELDRLKQERKKQQVVEDAEAERRKKVEEDRKRKQKEDEKRQRKMEEEERAKRQWEEEKLKKIQAEKKRMRTKSEQLQSEHDNKKRMTTTRSEQPMHSEHEESEEEYMLNTTYTRKKPTPPSRPKPQETRRPKRQQQQQQRPSPSTGEHTAMYEQADRMNGAFEDTGQLSSCFNCGRKFAQDRLEKHEKFCKNATKKRKVMDPTKTRTQGTELEQYVAHRQPTPKAKKTNWRSQHESFMNAIKYAKKVKQIEQEGGNLADLPPPPPSENPDYVQCPHCTRRFNPGTAERHIPHCKNAKSRPAAPPRKR